MIGVRAEDIILAMTKPEGLSARNLLPGVVHFIRKEEEDVTVKVSISKELPDLAVKIAHPTVKKLGLEKGREVFLVIKARACQVISKMVEPRKYTKFHEK